MRNLWYERDSGISSRPSVARRTAASRASRAQRHHGYFCRAARRIRADGAGDGARTAHCSGGIWLDALWVLDDLQAVEKLLESRESLIELARREGASTPTSIEAARMKRLHVWVRTTDGSLRFAGELATTDPVSDGRFESEFESAAPWVRDSAAFHLDTVSLPLHPWDNGFGPNSSTHRGGPAHVPG